MLVWLVVGCCDILRYRPVRSVRYVATESAIQNGSASDAPRYAIKVLLKQPWVIVKPTQFAARTVCVPSLAQFFAAPLDRRGPLDQAYGLAEK